MVGLHHPKSRYTRSEEVLHDGGEFFPGEREPGRAYAAIERMVEILLDGRVS